MVLVAASTDVTRPPCDSAIRSIMPGYNSFQAASNSFCWENPSLASRIKTFERGFLFFR